MLTEQNVVTIYNNLLIDTDCPQPIDWMDCNFKINLIMKKHGNPGSISKKEFEYLENYITRHNYKRGYELATAFGISALAAGLGFKQTNGRLISVDAYIEEHYGCATKYQDKCEIYTNADGYKVANYLAKKFNIENHVSFHYGWSPRDIPEILSRELNGDKLDYVFIDAQHYDDCVIADIDVVIPYLATNFTLFFHDVHCFTSKFTDFLLGKFNKTYEIVVHRDQGYNLSKLEI